MREIEDVILRHPAVTGVALIAKPHDRLGEVGCAVVTVGGADGSGGSGGSDGDGHGARPTLADLTGFLDEQGVTKQFWPEDLVIVDAFPMTPSGKVQKYQLRNEVLGLR